MGERPTAGLVVGLTAAAVPLAILGGVSGLCFWYGSRSNASAAALHEAHVEPIAAVIRRADTGGDAGMAAVRGLVVVEDPQQALRVPGVAEPVAIVREDVALRKMTIVENKLQERTVHAASKLERCKWVLQDSTGAATVGGSMPLPELRAAPMQYEPVSDEGLLEVRLRRDGVYVTSRDRERVVGIQRTPYVLTAGTMLTVIGRATLDGLGGLSFSAGPGPLPSLVTTQTLAEIRDSYSNAGWWARAAGYVFLAIGAGCALTIMVGAMIPENKAIEGAHPMASAPATRGASAGAASAAATAPAAGRGTRARQSGSAERSEDPTV